MSDYNSNPVPLGKANTGSAVVFGDGLGALRYLQKVDIMQRQQKARAQAAAQRTKEAQESAILGKVKFNTDGGVHYLPMMNEKRNAMYKDIEAISTDSTRSRAERQLGVQQKIDEWNAELAAGKANDDLVASEIKRYQADKRYNTAATSKLLTDSLFQRETDGSLTLDERGNPKPVPAQQWDSRSVMDGITKGNGHLVGNEVYGQFLDNIPENSVTYSREPLAGGRGMKQVAKSDIYELTPEGKLRRDPVTNRPVLRDSQETLAAFDSDKLSKQWLDGQVQQHKQLISQATEKMGRYEELTPQEAQAIEIEKSPAGPRMELFKKDILRYGYGREEQAILQKDARVPRAAGRAAGPKFSEEGGTSFGPEVVGGTGAQGTPGLLALSSSDPLFRVKADGTRQPHTAKLVHRRYNLLQNGQASRLVDNNAAPQQLDYIKPQLHVTTQDGRVVTPKDPTLEQRYQQGDRQPLLNWVRAQRENDPTTRLKWHFLAVPTHDKLTAENGAEAIFDRLKRERAATHKSPGDPGYQGDEKLLRTAQQMASQQGASLLVPYEDANKRDIDGATGYVLRKPKQRSRMQAELDYFERETAPRPVEQRNAPKKKIGVDFGTAAPTAPPVAPSTPTFKRAGAKKTGISF